MLRPLQSGSLALRTNSCVAVEGLQPEALCYQLQTLPWLLKLVDQLVSSTTPGSDSVAADDS